MDTVADIVAQNTYAPPVVDEQLITATSDFVIEDQMPIDIASAVLEGYSGDYAFFAIGQNAWVLLYDPELSIDIVDGHIQANRCKAVGIACNTVDTGVYNPITLAGDIATAAVPPEISRITLDGSLHVYEHKYQYNVAYGDITSVSVSIGQDDLVYSSVSGYPKLIEGVQNYAFAQTFLAVSAIIFVLVDRLFSRVCRAR